jgi:RNA polymerase sigma factor (sigma-70 family)
MRDLLRCISETTGDADRASSDAELLKRFATQHDEAAFTTLLRRYGSVVWGVCRRMLRADADAEDAFQATFLLLVQKAASLREPEGVGNWLYGVACRTALQARTSAARRREKESRPWPQAHGNSADLDVAERELGAILDEELNQLPTTYRAAVVLCELLGRTKQQAAEELGIPEGTISSRLARGRELLRQRLLRRGVGFSAALLADVLPNYATAAAPPALLATTTRAALLVAAGHAVAGVVPAPVIALMKGVLQAMFLTKLRKQAVLILVAGVLGLWGLALGQGAQVAEPEKPGAGRGLVAPDAADGGPKAEAPEAEPKLKLEVIAPAKPQTVGEEIQLEVILSTESEQGYRFGYSSFPQYFGIYVLGPWGLIQPDPAKIRPENWMHGEGVQPQQMTVAKGKPYRTNVKLSDYFKVADTIQFKPGAYQVNVKFYDRGLGMASPIDSGAVRFELAPKK